MQLRTEAIVLKNHRLDEDRVLTLLTRENGVITAFANGADRPRSKLASSTELLCYSHFVLFTNRDRTVVDHADSERIFFGLRENLQKLALASYFAELTAHLAPHGEAAEEQLRLLLNALHYLERGLRPDLQLKALYELRLLTFAGYMPGLVGCSRCGEYNAAGLRFFPAKGELVCEGCLRETSARGGVLLPPGVLAAMRHIVFAPPDKLFGFTLSGEGIRQLAKLSEEYLQHQVERTFPTLEFYRSISQAGL